MAYRNPFEDMGSAPAAAAPAPAADPFAQLMMMPQVNGSWRSRFFLFFVSVCFFLFSLPYLHPDP